MSLVDRMAATSLDNIEPLQLLQLFQVRMLWCWLLLGAQSTLHTFRRPEDVTSGCGTRCLACSMHRPVRLQHLTTPGVAPRDASQTRTVLPRSEEKLLTGLLPDCIHLPPGFLTHIFVNNSCFVAYPQALMLARSEPGTEEKTLPDRIRALLSLCVILTACTFYRR